jgi:hypothetical protein
VIEGTAEPVALPALEVQSEPTLGPAPGREARPGRRAAITISAAAPRSGSRAPTTSRDQPPLLGHRQRRPSADLTVVTAIELL